jgi:hypothetical protein
VACRAAVITADRSQKPRLIFTRIMSLSMACDPI